VNLPSVLVNADRQLLNQFQDRNDASRSSGQAQLSLLTTPQSWQRYPPFGLPHHIQMLDLRSEACDERPCLA
jgi:hypothetical protein